MNPDSFFCHLSSKGLAKIIEEAKELVCYSAPGIVKEPAEALVALSKKIGAEKLTVCIDCDERVLRMGYGDLEAVKMLRKAGIAVNHFPKLRSALCIVDKEGYSFTPTALYLEAELGIESCNAIRLSPEQVGEALMKFHGFMESKTAMVSGKVPPQEMILIAESERKEILSAPEEPSSETTISLEAVDEKQLSEIERSFQVAPPVPFDLARQVRVFESYIQYVELKLRGAALQRQRVSIPESLQQLGQDNKELEGRLKTTFELIEKESDLSSRQLDDKLKEVRKNFTRSLGDDKGRVMLKNRKKDIEERLDAIRKKLEDHKAAIEESLEIKIEKAIDQVSNYYLSFVKNNPPDKMKKSFSEENIQEDKMLEWVKSELRREFPNVKQIINGMTIEVNYKDITYETLKEKEFINKIKVIFPNIEWNALYKEFMAAGEHSSEQKKAV